MNQSTLKIVLQAVDNASATLRDVSGNVSAMDQTLSKTAGRLDKTGKDLTTKVTLPIVALGTASVVTVAKFDDSMSRAQALMGATADETDIMREATKKWGSETPHSASAVADALGFFALAGYNATESIEAMPGLLALASASGLDLATSADIVTDTMSAFRMETQEAGRASDIFATVQAKANTNVAQLGEAMKYAAPAAASLGHDLESTAGFLGILADNGLKGSMAGTTFTAVMRDMTKVNKDGANAMQELGVNIWNADGTMKDLNTIMIATKDATKNMTDEQRNLALSSIFGAQSLKGMNIMLGTSEERLLGLTEELYNAEGNAQEMANVMENNLGGSFRELMSATEGLMIEIGEHLAPVIRQIAQIITAWTGKFRELSPEIQKVIIIVGLIVAAIGPLLIIIATLIKVFLFLKSVFFIIKAAFLILTGPIGLVILAVIAVIAIIVLLVKNWEWVKEQAGRIWNWIKDNFVSIVQTIIKEFALLPVALPRMINAIIKHFTGVDLFKVGQDMIQGLINGLWNKLGALADTARNIANSVKNTLTSAFGIRSPSKWFAYVADMNIDGFIGETEKRLADVRASTRHFVDSAKPDVGSQSSSTVNNVTNNNVVFDNDFNSGVMSEDIKMSFVEMIRPQLQQVLGV